MWLIENKQFLYKLSSIPVKLHQMVVRCIYLQLFAQILQGIVIVSRLSLTSTVDNITHFALLFTDEIIETNNWSSWVFIL